MQKVLDRLQHPEEHQPNAYAGGKKHREPSDRGILGDGLPSADPYLAERGDSHTQAEQHGEVGGEQEQPVEPGGEPGPGIPKDLGRPLREQQRAEDKDDDGECGNREDRLVDIRTRYPGIAPSAPVAGSVVPPRVLGHLAHASFATDLALRL